MILALVVKKSVVEPAVLGRAVEWAFWNTAFLESPFRDALPAYAEVRDATASDVDAAKVALLIVAIISGVLTAAIYVRFSTRCLVNCDA